MADISVQQQNRKKDPDSVPYKKGVLGDIKAVREKMPRQGRHDVTGYIIGKSSFPSVKVIGYRRLIDHDVPKDHIVLREITRLKHIASEARESAPYKDNDKGSGSKHPFAFYRFSQNGF